MIVGKIISFFDFPARLQPKETQKAKPPKQIKCTILSAKGKLGIWGIVGWLER